MADIGNFLSSIETSYSKLNDVLGITSRSILVDTGIKTANGDPDAEQALTQVITTLSVLDVLGGPVAKIVDTLGDMILTNKAFHSSKKAFNDIGFLYADYIIDLEDAGKINKHDAAKIKSLKVDVKSMKREALETLVTDIDDALKNAPDSKALKSLRRARGHFKNYKLLSKIGPVFDILSIGINSWGLGEAKFLGFR